MLEDYEYIKLLGIVAIGSGLIKIVLGLLGYSFGAHYLSSGIIITIGLVVFVAGKIMQKRAEE